MRPVLDALPPSEPEPHLHLGHRGAERADEGRPLRRHLPRDARAPDADLGLRRAGAVPAERKYAFPFVLLGTVAFLIGAAFCYLVVLPTMFKFLLSSGDTAPIKARVERARAVEVEALRFARSGDFDRAANLARRGGPAAHGDGRRPRSPRRTGSPTARWSCRPASTPRAGWWTPPATGSAWPRRRRCGSRWRERIEAVDAFQSGSAWEGLGGARAVRLAPRRCRGSQGSAGGAGCGRCRRRSPPVRARWPRRPGPARCSP
jgi:hypothetical protein